MVRVGELITFSIEGKDIKCKIERIAEDTRFLSVIEDANTLRIGKTMTMSIMRQNGIEAGEGIVVKARQPVVSDAQEKGVYLNKLEYLIKVTRPFKRVQKRNAYRHECYLPVVLSDINGTETYNSHVLDLSAGGAKILTNKQFISNKVINIFITLGKKNMHLFGIVLGVDDAGEAVKNYKFVMRVKFTQITNTDEDVIIKYIFSEYRKAAQKKLAKREEKLNKKGSVDDKLLERD